MTDFTVRVELHNAEWQDYDQLHTAMDQQGFSTVIESSDGKLYAMPPAEYNFEGDLSRSQVLERAKAAAGTTRKKYSILVTQASGRTWSGLTQV